jgi:hypothetical protein
MKPYVIIELDKPRKLRFSINQLVEIEEHLGKNIMELFRSGNLGLKELRTILWIGLKWEDPRLTIQKAGELMDLVPLNYIAEKIGEALTVAFGETEQTEGGDEKNE